MEKLEVADCVFSRIQRIEPENAMKLIGYLLLKYSQKEFLEFALGPDDQILSLINEAKAYIVSSRKVNMAFPMQFNQDPQFHYMPYSQTFSRTSPSPSDIRIGVPRFARWLSPQEMPLPQNIEILPSLNTDLICKQTALLGLKDQPNDLNHFGTDQSKNYCVPDAALAGGFCSNSNERLRQAWLESSPKACHYFHKGYCKNGINCRFYHGQITPEQFKDMHDPELYEFGNQDHLIPPGSFAKLEMEIAELLKSKRGAPISIASLPNLYHEKYGKMLQADGYLTESQRHGKGGFSLTKLLNQLNHNIQLIDRPHGQHSVILAEDAPKYTECKGERVDRFGVLLSSHQIYLTFPAESMFSEQDVFNYFNQYGPVHDVRIPRQEKRMFGFVSFLYSETVKVILAMGHPHYICGSRVLVKPYKEKSKLTDKKYSEKEPPICFPSQCFAMDHNTDTMLNTFDGGYIQRQLSEGHELAIELDRRRLFELQLNRNHLTSQPYFSNKIDELKSIEVAVDVNNHSTYSMSGLRSDCMANQEMNNLSNDRKSDHIQLPDSPFYSPETGCSISTVI
ncbi:zinc finger CCCH domain-containing protein 18-like isoform X1 [Zingiber officinale]|uniref:zinc finger CCCH domain-containing protein 18-like isoform X1 n=1 Tax=Zingiber officinale TaxID=94328 RepID=UPI001C4C369C|nr:zinc finger CCCH domain-containing protein 18-like isoform X1 [Zingiber officinale]XP_042449635.1 zinc finger CCCH domain-containing protein 18-like isoform X1 [Zingiber officinale]XP_042449636.1 zinc finger CCCH domain-containing protein 18-like isoform X1 [Zingiber officinale]